MNQDFKFVNIAGGAYRKLVDVTRTTVVSDYQTAAEIAYEGCDSTVANILGNDAVI